MFLLHYVLKVNDFIWGELPICYAQYLSVKASLQSVSIVVSISFMWCDIGIMGIFILQSNNKDTDRLKSTPVRNA